MPFWDFGRERQQHHNLQEGLFQIASQTCSILVQVNNTNNISYGNNSTNVQYSNFSSDYYNHSSYRSNSSSATTSTAGNHHENHSRFNNKQKNCDISEQSVVLIPSSSISTTDATPSASSSSSAAANGFRRDSAIAAKNFFTHYKHRLSTVLEGNTPAGADDDFELWDQNQMLRSEQHPAQKWGHGSWCKPSCIPISVIFTLIVLVVLLPLLEHHNDKSSNNKVKGLKTPYICTDTCSIQLVESIPEGLVYPVDSPKFMSTFDAWNLLLDMANHSIDIGSFYWSLRQDDIYNHTSSWQGEKIFQKFLNIGSRTKVKIRIAQNQPTQDQPNLDTEMLIKRKAADVRSVNFPRLIGAGVLHTKLWIIDKTHLYVGSANMDWRSLTQVKELGVLVMNCSCLVNDLSKIFNVYWDMGKNDSRIPFVWPIEYNTNYNITNPMKINYNNESDILAYVSSSPPQMSPKGRVNDVDSILSVIDEAEKFIYISVMDYFPLMLYTPKTKYWPVIDNALRTAAIEHKVQIKMLISWWNHSRSSEDYFLRSLTSLTNSYKGVNIEIKRFVVPSTPDQAKIPFGRVNHNKYMVTESTAYIGTSNWSGDYFINTAGIGLILQDTAAIEDHDDHRTVATNRTLTNTIRNDLEKIFLRDWNSVYALDLIE